MPETRRHQGRIFWGLVLVLVGGLLLLDRMDRLDFGELVSRFWPAVFILIGLAILIGNNFRQAGSGIFFILFGTFFLLMRLEILGHTLWHYFWPLLIIVLGLWLLVRPARGPAKKNVANLPSGDLRLSAVLTGLDRRIEAQDFRGGRAEAILGALDLDLTRAGLAGGEATLELSVVMGGMDVRVPREWLVVLQATPVLGGIDDLTKPVPEAERKGVLHVRASAVLGGIDIKN
jgi:predicted membrane protein